MIPIAIRNEHNEADAVPAQAGISVFQQPANKKTSTSKGGGYAG